MKIWLGTKAWSDLQANKTLLIFFSGLLTISFIEPILVFLHDKPSLGSFFIKTYFAAAVMSTYACIAFSLSKPKLLLAKQLTSIFFIITALSCFSSSVIAGAKPLGYSLTRIEGEYFYCIKLILFCSIFSSLLLFFYRFIKLKDKKAEALCIAVTPILLSPLFIFYAQSIGLPINGLFVNSLTSTASIFLFLQTEDKHKLINLRSKVFFWSKEFKARRLLLNAHAKLLKRIQQGQKISLKKYQDDSVNILITAALDANGNDNKKAAEQLSVSLSTLYRKKLNDK